jgi:hypothetical protein
MERKPEEYKQPTSHYQEDEIDLIAIAKTLWEGRKTIIKTTIIFACIGLFVALTTPAQYTSTVVVKPILSDSKANIGGSLGGLAAMAGINLGGTGVSAEIHPTLYPKIIESYKFQKELMQTPIYVSELDREVTFEEYYTEVHKPTFFGYLKKYTLGLPGLLMKSIKKNKEVLKENKVGIKRVSEVDKALLEVINDQFKINVDDKDGFVALSATMPQNIQSAQLVISAQMILQREVITHKLQKVKEDLLFIEERHREKKLEFERAQNSLATYRDKNRNVNTEIAKTEEERLMSEYQLAFSVYSELAKQVETQKIQVKENTPVFVVLQEAVVPISKSSSSSVVIILVWLFFGFFVGILIIWVKQSIIDIEKAKES